METKHYSIVLNSQEEAIDFLTHCAEKEIDVELGATFVHCRDGAFGLRFAKEKNNKVTLWDSDAIQRDDYNMDNINTFLNIVQDKYLAWKDLEIGDVFKHFGFDHEYVKVSDDAFATLEDSVLKIDFINNDELGHTLIKLDKKVKLVEVE